ncbi:hypothetical protein DPMN_053331 [Dreissena polymorpha]|uniref:Uncharacterized protein n=1 Tax=Dreissena polymorpha TaxID=45954 RepID=A0A9D4CLX2_DREPO|nr:hypothetical protein DPMN_053331 [Dreissena polymorpha]
MTEGGNNNNESESEAVPRSFSSSSLPLTVRQKNFISQGNATVFGEENMASSGESFKIYYDCKVRKPRWSYDDSTMDDKENTRTPF